MVVTAIFEGELNQSYDLFSVHPEMGDFQMTLSAVSDQHSANQLSFNGFP